MSALVSTTTLLSVGWILQQSPEPGAPGPSAPSEGLVQTAEFLFQVVGPVLGTGLVGSLFLMLLFRIKIMPTYVYDDALKDWKEERERLEKERVDERERTSAERQRLESENTELKSALKDANLVYTKEVIPTLTRVLDAERELVDLRREEAAERRRRGLPD